MWSPRTWGLADVELPGASVQLTLASSPFTLPFTVDSVWAVWLGSTPARGLSRSASADSSSGQPLGTGCARGTVSWLSPSDTCILGHFPARARLCQNRWSPRGNPVLLHSAWPNTVLSLLQFSYPAMSCALGPLNLSTFLLAGAGPLPWQGLPTLPPATDLLPKCSGMVSCPHAMTVPAVQKSGTALPGDRR